MTAIINLMRQARQARSVAESNRSRQQIRHAAETGALHAHAVTWADALVMDALELLRAGWAQLPPGSCATSPLPVVAHATHAEFAALSICDPAERLVVPQAARDHDVIAAGADQLLVLEVRGADQGFADVQQLPVPPHLFGRSAAAHTRA